MRKILRATLEQLAKEADRELDDALVILWDAGLEKLSSPKDEITGSRLIRARRALLIPTPRDLTSPAYWQKRLSISELELRQLLVQLRIPMSKKATRLPKGAIKKLRSAPKTRPISQTIPSLPPPEPIIVEREESDPLFTWKTVGHEKKVRLLKLEEVLAIHNALVADFLAQEDPIDPPGPRDDNIIASAVFRQHTAIGGQPKYLSIEMTAAALLHSLVHNHPFHNGNKRTALVSMLVLLDVNKVMLTCDQHELFKFVLQLAQHKIVDTHFKDLADREVVTIAEWIVRNSRQVERWERPLPLRRLQHILTKHGCEFEHGTRGRNLKVTRTIISKTFLGKSKTSTFTSTIHLGSEGSEAPRAIINKLRSDLQLSEEQGIDSAAFYGDSPFSIDDFIVKYRKTLLRLAKL